MLIRTFFAPPCRLYLSQIPIVLPVCVVKGVDNFRAKGQVSVNKMFDTGCNFHWPQISRILHVLMYIFTTHGTDENVAR